MISFPLIPFYFIFSMQAVITTGQKEYTGRASDL